MEEGLLSLKWNNHKSTFFQVLSVLRQKLTFTDVTVACEGRLYPAHKFVLAACSEYFSEVFGSISGSNLVVVLKDVRRTDLEYLLDYMYLGQVDVAQSELSSLIKTAECLRIKGLAIPDDEPHKTRARVAEEHREGSPPAKKKRHLPADEDRGASSLIGVGSNSGQATRVHLDPLPPPPELNSLVQRLRQPSPLTPQTTAPQTTTPQTSKPQPAPLPLPQVIVPGQGAATSPTLSAPPLPLIKQEAADPTDATDVFEGYEDGETKPNVSDGAVPGPSGLQGSSDTWDGDGDMGGFEVGGGGGGGGGGDGYSETGLEEHGDAEVQGGRIRVKSRRELGLLVTTTTITTTTTPTSVTVPPLSPHTTSPIATLGNSVVLLSPSVAQPCLLRTSPLPPHLPISPLPPPSPVASSPTTSPLALSYPLKCPYCGYVGTSESVLLRHLRTHGGGGLAGVQLYHCSSCPYSATQWESVRRHSWRQHRTEIEPEKNHTA